MASKRRPWDGIVPSEEQEVYALAGFGTTGGVGRKPALLVIDVQYRTVGTCPRPIRDAIAEYPTSCGDGGWAAVAHIARIVRCFRDRKLPVIYPHIAPKARYDQGAFAEKVPGVMQVPPAGYRFVEEVAPEEGDILLPKNHASAFFGTPLTSYLVALGVDSLVFTGCTTSGCIRASVVDAVLSITSRSSVRMRYSIGQRSRMPSISRHGEQVRPRHAHGRRYGYGRPAEASELMRNLRTVFMRGGTSKGLLSRQLDGAIASSVGFMRRPTSIQCAPRAGPHTLGQSTALSGATTGAPARCFP